MNNFNYLLLIIFIILLIFYLYINYNINFEFFQQLPQADLGPIKFLDFESNELLGKYPSNWKESELYSKDTYLEPTIIYIKRGPRGAQGSAGTTGTPGVCKGNINIGAIVGDKLEIASDNLKILSENTTFKNKLCFGDDKKACLDKNLIDKIKYNKSIQDERDLYKNRVDTGFYVTKTAKDLETSRADQNDKNAQKYKKDFEDCEKLINDTSEYVTRNICDKEINDKNTEWVDKGYEKTIADLSQKVEDLELEAYNLNQDMHNKNKYRTAEEYAKKITEIGKLNADIAELKGLNNNYIKNFVERGYATWKDVHPTIQKLYGEITTADSLGDPGLYIKKRDCKCNIASDNENYGLKVSANGNWGEIGTKIGSYGKITSHEVGAYPPEKYIQRGQCNHNIANDATNYGLKVSKNGNWGEIRDQIGFYGKITNANNLNNLNDYIKKRDCHYNIANDRRNYGLKVSENGNWGKIGTGENEYIIRSEYNNLREQLRNSQQTSDMSRLTSINENSRTNNLHIYGDNLQFRGNSVTFNNKLCIRTSPDSADTVCLSADTIRKMNESPCGEKGEDGTCIG